MAHRVTLADVSRAAGVGIATVSRALATEPHRDVSPATRKRIREVADELGYRPSVAARALRSGGYHALSVVVPGNTWGWWEPVVRAAFQNADAHGYQVLVHPVAGRPGGAAAVIESLGNVPTEGALLFGSADDRAVHDAAQHVRLPLVAIDDVSEEVLVPTIGADSHGGAFDAVTHLVRSGRRRIAYVGSDNAAMFARDRLRGYRDALDAAGIVADEGVVVLCRDSEDESVERYPEVDELLRAHPEIDAIFCEFDLIAAPVLRSLRAVGRAVPSDVALMGFDDERAAQLLDPTLSTIRQPYEDMGARAVDVLLRMVAGEPVPAERELLPTTLRLRRSS
ncbi:LacI family DNA-binding transcriptional regulator [Leifsonia poae]|uniref:LacI family DNA-binding transcriptional regulator n=1 Tax=Leifsonia poae TaxID=110933 RepID=UPI001CBC8E06|nr:LacI family DNA-binding transcriptional regulator [Leifsonia poae]